MCISLNVPILINAAGSVEYALELFFHTVVQNAYFPKIKLLMRSNGTNSVYIRAAVS